jgi:hypothetical protein
MLLIQFPTRERPTQAVNIVDKYIENLDDPSDCIVNINCDIDDATMNDPEVIARLKIHPQVTINFNPNQSKVEAVNKNVRNLNFDIVIVASDDMRPVTKGYDRILKEEMNKNFPDLDGVLWFFDGYNETTNTFPILGRKYYERFGYIYNPTYFSLFCDNEFQQVAAKHDKLKKYDQVLFTHDHPDYGKVVFDELYRKNYLFGHLDLNNYNKRKAEDFCEQKLNKLCSTYLTHEDPALQNFLMKFKHDHQLVLKRTAHLDAKSILNFFLDNMDDGEYTAYCSTALLPPQIKINDHDMIHTENFEFFAIKNNKKEHVAEIIKKNPERIGAVTEGLNCSIYSSQSSPS